MIWLGFFWKIWKGSFALQIATAAVVAWGALKINNVYQRHVGAQQHAEKVEKASKAAASLGGRAAHRSADARVRGIRDPSTRDD
jgi:hypothetical protein